MTVYQKKGALIEVTDLFPTASSHLTVFASKSKEEERLNELLLSQESSFSESADIF